MKDYIQNEPLSKHTTLGIGGPAKFFVEAESEEELIDIVKKVLQEKTPFIVIGEGSNLLVSDKGYEGLVVKNTLRGISEKDGLITAKAGSSLQDLVDFSKIG